MALDDAIAVLERERCLDRSFVSLNSERRGYRNLSATFGSALTMPPVSLPLVCAPSPETLAPDCRQVPERGELAGGMSVVLVPLASIAPGSAHTTRPLVSPDIRQRYCQLGNVAEHSATIAA
jgi:hypothetical protein